MRGEARTAYFATSLTHKPPVLDRPASTIRSKGELTEDTLSSLLADDLKKDDVEDIKISEDELDMIMDRGRLFGEVDLESDGKMYSILEDKEGESDLLKSTF